MTKRCSPFFALLLIAVAVLLVDRWTKGWVLSHFMLGESRSLTSFLSFTFVQNTGTAFGLFQDNNHVLLWVSIAVLIGLLSAARRFCEQGGTLALVGIGLVAGGAVGNLIDRFQYGRVIDFIDFHFWPVFNVADSAISTGTAALALSIFLSDHRGKT